MSYTDELRKHSAALQQNVREYTSILDQFQTELNERDGKMVQREEQENDRKQRYAKLVFTAVAGGIAVAAAVVSAGILF